MSDLALPRWLRGPRWWALLTLGLALGFTAVTVTRLPGPMLVPLVAGWLLLARRLRWGAPPHPEPPARVWPWSLAPLAVWGVYVYLADSFGIVDLGAVFFHLQAGISEHGGGERIVAAVLYTLAMLLVLAAFTWLVRVDHRWRLQERLLALVLLASNPLLFGLGQRSAAIVTEDGAWLDRQYVAPVIRQAPPTPPNLLVFYLESLERTYADREGFAEAYAPLAALGQRGVVFEGVRQLDNTGWTMAGMIASQCGTPLMPAGLLHDSQFEPLERVVPGVDCLGDLLAARGYTLSYLGGASTRFAGKGRFYTDHGFDRVRGRETLAPRLDDPSYLNSWGLYDDSLYGFVEEEVRRLEAEGGPWGLVNLSLGTHPPHGFPARACRERQGEFDGVDILYSVECSAWLVSRLVRRLEAEGLLEDTLVVIASDHLTMRVSAWDRLIAGPRANTFMLIGNDLPPRRIRVEASTMDVLPTVLEAMGFTLDRHRAGLGVSLFAHDPTLVEGHGLETLNARLKEETALQERLWQGLDIRPPFPPSEIPPARSTAAPGAPGTASAD
ncbi:sulfatase-like hydrolase/transferase [Halomonas nitroreducens]|uniref:Phosphatidylglycerol--membrane-oligosaccharide glycerophosphotransferase n=1 Tax=Halomonas nitroreducens TaxID=447425 RepID=A0A431V757_9GAMM|nr:sulfatase-like hydrolase/transferase [Halomonas nitroreducens]RTR05629.1 phosphatidylglycerol--membrane-oligosaccharide glycerophosphotransferase [Halomonas nitroreducens]